MGISCYLERLYYFEKICETAKRKVHITCISGSPLYFHRLEPNLNFFH